MMKTVLSLGGGVQSSTLALMAKHGEVAPMPDFAIFSDTQAEPQSVYTWLDWLEKQLPFPVVRVGFGDCLTKPLEVYTSKKTGKKYMQQDIPAYTSGAGQMWRQCTGRWKIEPIHRYLRSIGAHKVGVTQWMGISADEAHRQKPNQKKWITNHYPLIDLRMTRGDCLKWMDANGYPEPPRSACVFCPYHSDKEWNRLKLHEPTDFQKAVEFERGLAKAVAKNNSLDKELYLHPSRKPLDSIQFRHQDQPDLFGNECEGYCGN